MNVNNQQSITTKKHTEVTMNKQTAVEWLVEQISTSKYFYKVMEDVQSRSTIAQLDIFEQAKAMTANGSGIGDVWAFEY